jgi:transcriptional regulator with XRE-family HTH domain
VYIKNLKVTTFDLMTHIQEVFISNLRFFRKKKGLSQLKFSELLNISPNYLNAVENGKNFPSPEILQRILDTLKILPYQLFLEYPGEGSKAGKPQDDNIVIQKLIFAKQKLINQMDEIINDQHIEG